MAYFKIDKGLIKFHDVYKVRRKIQEVGGVFRADESVWVLAFTIENLEFVIDEIPNLFVPDGIDELVINQQKKERKLTELKKAAKDNIEIRLKIPGLKAILYPYQKMGVMYSLVSGSGMLIADEMGLGKSFQALALALMLKHQGRAKSALLVTPASLKFNWPLEIEKFTDEKYVVIDGTPEQRIAQWLRKDVFFYVVNYELLLEDLFGGKEPKEKDDETSEQRVRREKRQSKIAKRERILSPLRDKVWDFISVDEIHNIKNPGSKRSKNIKSLKGDFRIGLSGTPLDGKLEELHSVMEFIMPGLLGSRTRFLQKHAVTNWSGDVVSYKNINEVSEKIAPFFIRRLKKNVLKDLPDKIYENRIIELSPAERKIYNDIKKKRHEITEDAEAMVLTIRCKQFLDSPELIEEEGESSKLESFKEVIQEVVIENMHKVIIFSQYKKMTDILVRVLEEMGLKCLYIHGEVPKAKRAQMQEQFNTDDSIDCIIGTEAMSTGLNFIGGDIVINYDDNWAPAIMRQREDRAHRIGQKNTVTVINFICRDTIEERIRERLYEKEIVSNEVLGDGLDEYVLKRLGPKDILGLL